MNDLELEAEIEARVDPWLAHMRWRSDYQSWRDHRLFQENYQALHLGELEGHVPDLSRAHVLDVGSGMGGFAVALARTFDTPVVACEFNPAYNEIARLRARRYGLDLPACTAAGEVIPFRDGQFDVVTAWDVLEHVGNAQSFVAECARVLKPGGLFFFTAINRFAFRDPHYHLPLINYLPRGLAERFIKWRGRSKAASPFQDRQRLDEMHYFTMGRLTRLLQTAGLGDLVDLRSERAKRSANNKPHSLAARLQRFGLLPLAYSVYRTGITGTWEVMVRKI